MAFQRGTFPPSAGAARHRAKSFEVRLSLASFVRGHLQADLSRAAFLMTRGWNQQPQTQLHDLRVALVIGREINGEGILVLPMPVSMLLAEAEEP